MPLIYMEVRFDTSHTEKTKVIVYNNSFYHCEGALPKQTAEISQNNA